MKSSLKAITFPTFEDRRKLIHSCEAVHKLLSSIYLDMYLFLRIPSMLSDSSSYLSDAESKNDTDSVYYDSYYHDKDSISPPQTTSPTSAPSLNVDMDDADDQDDEVRFRLFQKMKFQMWLISTLPLNTISGVIGRGLPISIRPAYIFYLYISIRPAYKF